MTDHVYNLLAARQIELNERLTKITRDDEVLTQIFYEMLELKTIGMYVKVFSFRSSLELFKSRILSVYFSQTLSHIIH